MCLLYRIQVGKGEKLVLCDFFLRGLNYFGSKTFRRLNFFNPTLRLTRNRYTIAWYNTLPIVRFTSPSPTYILLSKNSQILIIQLLIKIRHTFYSFFTAIQIEKGLDCWVFHTKRENGYITNWLF